MIRAQWNTWGAAPLGTALLAWFNPDEKYEEDLPQVPDIEANPTVISSGSTWNPAIAPFIMR